MPCPYVFLGAGFHDLYYTYGTAEDEREFDYTEGSEKGPKHWGELNKTWAACNNGDLQSPIDLSNQRVKVIPKLGDLKRNYKLCNATVKNRGHDISVSKFSNPYQLCSTSTFQRTWHG